ncbi:hypothetical protein [Streptomyces sp. NPDC087294]|uniref:hypothetical protein n=1 Tax=Streptomyces sp. NPDC087294 TaxID=3365777 RepID=UPI003805F116
MKPEEMVNTQTWVHYGQVQLDRGYMPPVPEQMKWGFRDGVGRGPMRSDPSVEGWCWPSDQDLGTRPCTWHATMAPS